MVAGETHSLNKLVEVGVIIQLTTIPALVEDGEIKHPQTNPLVEIGVAKAEEPQVIGVVDHLIITREVEAAAEELVVEEVVLAEAVELQEVI